MSWWEYIDVLGHKECKFSAGFMCKILIFQFMLTQIKSDFENAIFSLVLVTGIFRSYVIWWMPWDLTDDKSLLVQVMSWCRQTSNHYLSQCWPRSMLPFGITWPQLVKQNNTVSDYSTRRVIYPISYSNIQYNQTVHCQKFNNGKFPQSQFWVTIPQILNWLEWTMCYFYNTHGTKLIPGANFTNTISIMIQIWWKIHSALIKGVFKWSLWNFAPGTTTDVVMVCANGTFYSGNMSPLYWSGTCCTIHRKAKYLIHW